VLFDARSQKWIAESFGADLGTIQIAVSTTSNALGTWKSTSFTGFAGAGGVADYPTLALDKGRVYIGTNDFGGPNESFQGETLNVISRSDLFGATPTTTSLKQFFTPLSAIIGGADPGFAIQGVNQLDNKDSGKILSVSIQTSDLIRYDVANPGQSIATLSNITYLGTKPYNGNNPGAQPGDKKIGGPVIDTLDDRVFQRGLGSQRQDLRRAHGHSVGQQPHGHRLDRLGRDDQRPDPGRDHRRRQSRLFPRLHRREFPWPGGDRL